MTSLEQFVRHAELFGVEAVLETAVSVWRRELTPVDLTRLLPAEVDTLLEERDQARATFRANVDRLRIELDAVEADRRGRRFVVGKRRRRSEVETARYACALAQEIGETGLTRMVVERRVAEKLGVSEPYARRMLNLGCEMSGKPGNAPSKPSVQAESFATKQKSDTGLPLVKSGRSGQA